MPTIPSTSFPNRPTAAGYAIQLQDMLVQTSVEEEREMNIESSQLDDDMQEDHLASSDDYDAYFVPLTDADIARLP